MTRSLPEGESLLVRTDFTDDAAWAQTLAAVVASYDEDTVTGLTPVDDAAFDNLPLAALPNLIADQSYLFLADTTTMTDPDHPILAVDTASDDLATFRIAPSAMAGVEVNLFLANMDFDDFADNVDANGVYRGWDQ
ncbi:DUF6924 domain-containing protein [Nocardia lasii]|uniref:DUF6924 domain-containing protein n=1 Tax=Nocardia lasii TaxID=1616107 RepID=A0ABW1JWD7_9NOCA